MLRLVIVGASALVAAGYAAAQSRQSIRMDVDCVVSVPIEETLTIVNCSNGLYLGSVVLTQAGGRIGTVTCTNAPSGCARLMGILISPIIRFARGEKFTCEAEITGSAAGTLICPPPAP